MKRFVDQSIFGRRHEKRESDLIYSIEQKEYCNLDGNYGGLVPKH